MAEKVFNAREEAIRMGLDMECPEPPYPASTLIARMDWDEEPVRIGFDGVGDNWPTTWGDDDINYTTYGDGRGFGGEKLPRESSLSLGFARVHGHPPHHWGEDLKTDADVPVGWGENGIKSSGLLMVDSVLYLFVRNYKVDGDWRHSRLAWSIDKGKTWKWADWYFSDSFGCPDFVQCGKNYDQAKDEYVYIVSQDSNSAYDYTRHLVMARVPITAITDRRRYEFFAGTDSAGNPIWTPEIADRKPIFTDGRGVFRVGITYNPPLKRFFLATSHWVADWPGPRKHTSALGVFEASNPWGPWATVYYDDWWLGDKTCFHHKFPAKYISADGLEMWCLFSGQGGNYTYTLRRASLVVSRH